MWETKYAEEEADGAAANQSTARSPEKASMQGSSIPP